MVAVNLPIDRDAYERPLVEMCSMLCESPDKLTRGESRWMVVLERRGEGRWLQGRREEIGARCCGGKWSMNYLANRRGVVVGLEKDGPVALWRSEVEDRGRKEARRSQGAE